MACCLYLMGRKADARAFVSEILPKYQDYFEGFAIPFLKMLDEGNDDLKAEADATAGGPVT